MKYETHVVKEISMANTYADWGWDCAPSRGASASGADAGADERRESVLGLTGNACSSARSRSERKFRGSVKYGVKDIHLGLWVGLYTRVLSAEFGIECLWSGSLDRWFLRL